MSPRTGRTCWEGGAVGGQVLSREPTAASHTGEGRGDQSGFYVVLFFFFVNYVYFLCFPQ